LVIYHSLMRVERVKNSIITRIIVLGVAIVVLGGLVRWQLLSEYLREDLSRVSATQQEALAKYVAADLDAKLLARKTMLGQLALGLPQELLNRPDDLRVWLSERFRLQPLFDKGLFVTDVAGVPIADYPRRPERVVQRYADRDYIRGALKGDMVFGQPTMGRVAKEPIIPLAAPIMDRSGRVQAILVGITSLGASGFLTVPQTNAAGEGSTFLVISPKDRLYVASSEASMVLQPIESGTASELIEHAMDGFRGSGTHMTHDAIETIAGIASVQTTGWFVVAQVPSAQVLATIGRARTYVTANSFVVSLIFILVVGGLLALVFRPLLVSANAAERMATGELPLAPFQVQRNDEVGLLTKAFNRLLVTLLKQQKELEHIAQHDPLTHLPNRTLASDRLQLLLAQAQRSGHRVAVFYIDLDGFKAVNDQLGHHTGDGVLKQVAVLLAASVRESDTLARLGGDEFMLIAGDLDADRDRAEIAARLLAHKIIDVFKDPIRIEGHLLRVGASLGIAVGSGSVDPDTLRRAADDVMYRAKQAGGNRVELVSV
jgi:diguanylate cyclase (GGDEF)-like protein